MQIQCTIALVSDAQIKCKLSLAPKSWLPRNDRKTLYKTSRHLPYKPMVSHHKRHQRIYMTNQLMENFMYFLEYWYWVKVFFLVILSIQCKIRRDRPGEPRRSTGRSTCWSPLLYEKLAEQRKEVLHWSVHCDWCYVRCFWQAQLFWAVLVRFPTGQHAISKSNENLQDELRSDRKTKHTVFGESFLNNRRMLRRRRTCCFKNDHRIDLRSEWRKSMQTNRQDIQAFVSCVQNLLQLLLHCSNNSTDY